MKKLAIFDMDGTLFDTNEVNYFAYSKALEELGYYIDYDYYCNYCNGKHYKVFLPIVIGDDEKLIDTVHKRKKELYSEYLNKAKVNTHLFDIINKLIDNYYIALVTTASKKNTIEILKYYKKTECFDLILTHDDIEKVKPNPEGFIKAIEFFNVKEEDTIIFEDSDIGIEAALKTGATVFKIERFN